MTLAGEDSRNLSLPHQLLTVLTATLLTLKQNKSHAVDAGTKQDNIVDAGTKQGNIVDARTKQKPRC